VEIGKLSPIFHEESKNTRKAGNLTGSVLLLNSIYFIQFQVISKFLLQKGMFPSPTYEQHFSLIYFTDDFINCYFTQVIPGEGVSMFHFYRFKSIQIRKSAKAHTLEPGFSCRR